MTTSRAQCCCLLSSIERNVPEEARPVPAPGEHRQRHRDGHVDPDLPDLDPSLELTRGCAALREDRRAIAVLVRVDNGDRVIECVRRNDDENRAEDLLAVCSMT